MLKPNPLNSLFTAFKYFSVHVGHLLGILLLVASFVFLGEPVGIDCLITGGLIYYSAHGLDKTLREEAKATGGNDDEGPDLPLGTV